MIQRRLVVMRHAKSSWSDASLSDHQRPLNARGRADAPRVAASLRDRQWQPQYVVSSDSQRTRETWQRMADAFGNGDISADFSRQLYLAGVEELRRQVSLVPDHATTVLVLGHNPGWEHVVVELTGDNVLMKTACAALLEGAGETWCDALRGRKGWRLIDVIRPREI